VKEPLHVAVQSEVDECLVRCVATPGGQETNNGINTAPVSLCVCLSLSLALCQPVGFSFSRCVVWTVDCLP